MPDTTATSLDGLHCVIKIEARGDTDAPGVRDFVTAAKAALGFWGGYSHPMSDQPDEVSISFDPTTVSGGLDQIAAFLQKQVQADDYFEWSITLRDAHPEDRA